MALKKQIVNGNKEQKKDIKIGIRTRGGIGDALLLTPSLRKIKEVNSNCKIFCVANKDHKEILKDNPYIDVLSISPDNSAFRHLDETDEIILTDYVKLKPSITSKKHAMDIISTLFSLKLEEKDKKMDIFLTEEHKKFALEVIKDYKKIILLGIDSNSGENHEWFVGRWEKLSSKLKKEGFSIIQVGVEGAKRIKGTIDMVGKTTVMQCIALLKYADVYLGVDSFLNHATNVVGTPGVVLFGGSTPVTWGYSHNINIFKNIECSPCIDTPRSKTCKDRKCMKAITVEDVFDAVNSLYAKINNKKSV